MTSKSDHPFWNRITLSATAITAVLIAVGTFFELPEKIKNAADVMSGSEPEQITLPTETYDRADVQVDASSKVEVSSGDSSAISNPETNIEIGSPSTRVHQAPVINNQSSATYGDQSQSVIVNPVSSRSKLILSNEIRQPPSPPSIIADLYQPDESYAQPSTSSASVNQSSDGSVLSPINHQSSGNSVSVGGNVISESSSDTYNGTVYNGSVCEGAIGSSCAPESSTENDFSGASITGNTSR